MNNYTYYNPARARQHALIVTFAWMIAGLMVTGITSLLMMSTGFIYVIYQIPMLALILMLAQFGLVFAFSASMYRSSVNTMRVLFFAYAFTLGISMTSICLAYGLGTVSLAFIMTSVYFLCLVVIGVTTKRDLSKIGTICLAALIALILTQIIMMLFRVGMNVRLISILGLLIFTGITAWDVNRMNQLLVSSEGDVVTQEKISIFMALQLYLDFINIFLYILRLLGSRRN